MTHTQDLFGERTPEGGRPVSRLRQPAAASVGGAAQWCDRFSRTAPGPPT
ncbi:hypothetical protein [Streptomyces sp. NPDC003077]